MLKRNFSRGEEEEEEEGEGEGTVDFICGCERDRFQEKEKSKAKIIKVQEKRNGVRFGIERGSQTSGAIEERWEQLFQERSFWGCH